MSSRKQPPFSKNAGAAKGNPTIPGRLFDRVWSAWMVACFVEVRCYMGVHADSLVMVQWADSHVGEGSIHLDEFLGCAVSLDFMFFTPQAVTDELVREGFVAVEVIERDPYPEVEYPSPVIRSRLGQGRWL